MTSKSMDIYGSGVIHKPVIVDLDVSPEKVSGTYSMSSETPIETAKNDALAKLLKEKSADVIVEPKYEIEQVLGSIKLTVTGFPATYKNFRSVQKEDIELLNVGVVQKAKVEQPSVVKKKKTGLIVAGSILAAALIALLIIL